MVATQVESKKLYRFSYRIFVKVDKEREAMQVTRKLDEGDPVQLETVRDALHNAVDRIVGHFNESE